MTILTASTVRSYETAEALDGTPSADLLIASIREGDSGAIPARLDGSVWQFVEASQASATPGATVVYVELPDDFDSRVEALGEEARAAGDGATEVVCESALLGDEGARGECARLIADAEALRDSEDA